MAPKMHKTRAAILAEELASLEESGAASREG